MSSENWLYPQMPSKAKQEFPNKYIVSQKGFNVSTANILHEMRKRKNWTLTFVAVLFIG